LDLATSGGSQNCSVRLGLGGSIAPGGPIAVRTGGAQSYSIAPAGGYTLSAVRVDGVSQGPITSYSFNNVTTDHGIAAAFASPAAPLVVSGVSNLSKGNAALSVEDDTVLVISNIGSSGDDGVSFDAADASTPRGVEFANGGLTIDPAADNGARLVLDVD